MRRNLLVYLLAAAAACFGVAARAEGPACPLSAPDISAVIHEKGIDGLMHTDQGYKDWFPINACIATGAKAWLDIASFMLETTQYRPEVEDDVPTSVGSALPRNPADVLAEHWPAYFTISGYICSRNLYESFDDPASALAELDRRVAIVKDLKRPDLKKQIGECLAGFEQARKEIPTKFQAPPASSSASPPPSRQKSS